MESKLGKKQIIGLLVSFAVVGAVATWLLFFNKKEVILANFIPQSAMVVAKIEQPPMLIDSLSGNQLINNWEKTRFVQVSLQRGEALKALLAKEMTWFNQKNFFCSLHIISKEEADLLFYLSLKESKDQTTLQAILQQLQQNNQLVISSRNYEGIKITDIKHRKTGDTFSFILEKGFWVGSFSPLLIEDAVKHYTSKKVNSFVVEHIEALEQSSKKPVLCVNFQQIKTLYPYLLKNIPKQPNIGEMLQAAQLDAHFASDKLILNGWTKPSVWEYAWVNIWQEQEAQIFYLRNYLPNHAALFHRLSFSNEALFFKNLKNYWLKNEMAILLRRKELKEKQQIDIAQLEKQIDKEILEVIAEEDPQKVQKVMIMRVKNAQATAKVMRGWTKNATQQANYFQENYAGYAIFQSSVNELPSLLLGKQFLGYPTCFVAPIAENVLVLANDYEGLKSYIDKIQNEEVWAKSVKLSSLLDDIPEKQNWTTFVQPEKAWKWLYFYASPSWKKHLNKYEFLFKKVNYFAFQLNTGRNGRLWLNVSCQMQQATASNAKSNQWITELTTSITEKAITQPFVVMNHTTKAKELLVQDANFGLKLITLAGKQLWSAELDSKIITPIYQIDYYKNGKLQYLFATQNRLYLIDRNGRKVADFPKSFQAEVNLNTLNVFDYDRKKDYRYWLTNEAGRVYLLDKTGKEPEGWELNKVPYRTTQPAEWTRIDDKDYLVVIQENGVLQVYNRRGESLKGFPVDLDTKVSSEFFIQKGAGASKSFIKTVSNNGELIEVNFEGKVKRKQLVKPSDNTVFGLKKSTEQNTFLIVRQNLSEVALLSKEGNEIFETKFSTASPMLVQYFYYDTSTWFAAVTDTQAGFSYIFDTQGYLIGEPIPSTQQVFLDFNEAKSLLSVYSVAGKKLIKKTITQE